MINLSQAQALFLSKVEPAKTSENVSLIDALGRVASDDVVSKIQIPPSDNSAMDGFAVALADVNTEQRNLKDSNSITLAVSQRVPAGTQPTPLIPGTAARIFTGGVIPQGADAVVIQENCDYEGSDEVTINKEKISAKSLLTGANIRPAGQDISIGAVVVKKGQRLNAVDLSLLASIGHATVAVYVPLNVAIFSTGDELVEPGEPLNVGQIYNSNRTLLIALCKQLGFNAVDCGIVEDTLEATKAALLAASKSADVILSSGGVSVGEEDHIKPAVEAIGAIDLWKVQMKPGKPVAFGQVAMTPFLGLPGNPVSSFVVFQLLGLPLLRRLQGQVSDLPTVYCINSAFSKGASSREEYIRVRLERNSDGELVAHRFANLSSGVLSSLSWADGLVRQNIDQSIDIDQPLDFLPLHDAIL